MIVVTKGVSAYLTGIASPASRVEGTAHKLKANYSEHQNSEQDEKTDLQQRRHRFQNRLQNDL